MVRPTELIVQLMQVPRQPGIFILGCLERRITVFSQQTRALNLIYSLFREQKLQRGAKVAVVGGGAAGLTAAAGAARLGCRVTLLERMNILLPLWRSNHTRWLHPHIYDWPKPGSERDTADLPLLGWQAGKAWQVADQILDQWEVLRREHDIKVHEGARKVQLASGPELRWRAKGKDYSGQFDAVILAVGFGLEKKQKGAPFVSYWDDEGLDNPAREPNWSRRHYLISGTGDGGLVDLFRVRLQGFQHERLLKDFLLSPSLTKVKDQLLKLEADFQEGHLKGEDFFEHYKELPVSPELDMRLRSRLRPDTSAILNAESNTKLSARSCILNRFLASRLIALGVHYEPGTFEITRIKGRYKVTFQASGRTELFDEVVIRHGARPALERSFKDIWRQVGQQLRSLAGLDLTRRQIFEAEDFGGASAPQRPAAAAALRSESPAALPPQLDCFGREVLVRRLVSLLLEPEPLPTAVLGPPGVGKSTLIIEAAYASEIEKHYGGRRYFARLNGATSSELLVSAIAKVLGVHSESNLWEAVKGFLGSAPALLILDNVETPFGRDGQGTEALLTELRWIKGLALVLSARGTVRPYLPRAGEPIEVPQLGEAAAVDLFCSIAWKVDRKSHLLTTLLAEQQGLPLAIKLLAFVAERSSLEFTWQLWQEQRTRILRRPNRSEVEWNFDASLEVSIQGPLVTDGARELLSRLACLPNGAAQEDLAILLPSEGPEAGEVLSSVGLAYFEHGRLWMLEPIRDYVRQERAPSREERARIGEHYCEVAQKFGAKVGGAGGAAAITRLTSEVANLEQFIQEGLEAVDAGKAIDAAIALKNFMRFSGHGTPRVLEAARDAARRMGESRREARCLYGLGDIALRRTDYDRARQYFESAVLLFHQVNDLRAQGNSTLRLGIIALRRSEYELAKQKFEAALSLCERAGSILGQAQCIRRLGVLAFILEDHDQARKRYEVALELFRRVGSLLGQGHCQRSLGDIALTEGSHVQARRLFEEALPLFERVGDLLSQANCIKSLGEVALALGEHVQAQERFEAALALFIRVGDALGHAQCKSGLGDVALALGEHVQAREMFKAALPLYERIPDGYSMGWMHRRLAQLASDLGTRRQHLDAAQEAWLHINRPDLIKQMYAALGDA